MPDTIRLELPISMVQTVLTGLAELPLKHAIAPFRAIESQAQMQLQPQQPPAPPSAPPVPQPAPASTTAEAQANLDKFIREQS